MSEINLGRVVGEQGEQGEKGDPFLYTDFTPTQLAGLKGDPFTYADFTPTQLAGLKGPKGDPGDAGSGSSITSVSSIAALKAIPSPTNNSRIYVDDVGKEFVFTTNNTTPVNLGTVFQGNGGRWEMVTQTNYYASWFATPNVQTNQTASLQAGYAYATSKNRPYIIDDIFWAKETNNAVGMDGVDGSRCVLSLLNNSNITFTKLGTINLLTSNFTHYNMILGFNVKNVVVVNPKLNGDLLTHAGSDGEYGHGISLHSCENVIIDRPVTTNMWGDGIYIGVAWNTPNTFRDNTNIIINNALVDRTRRNGISFCSGVNVKILSPIVKNVWGADPQSGIDFEPEESSGTNDLKSKYINCVVDSATFINCKQPIAMIFFDDRDIDINMTGTTTCEMNNEYAGSAGINGINVVTISHPGKANANRLPIQNGAVYIENLVFKVTKGSNLQFNTVIRDATASGLPVIIGNIEYPINKDFLYTIAEFDQPSHNERKGLMVKNINMPKDIKVGIVGVDAPTLVSTQLYFDQDVLVELVYGLETGITFTNNSHFGGYMIETSARRSNSNKMINKIYFIDTGPITVNTSGDSRRLKYSLVNTTGVNTVNKLTISGVRHLGQTSISTKRSWGVIEFRNDIVTVIDTTSGEWNFDI